MCTISASAPSSVTVQFSFSSAAATLYFTSVSGLRLSVYCYFLLRCKREENVTDLTHNISHSEGQAGRGRKCLSSRNFFYLGAGVKGYKIEMCLSLHLAWKQSLTILFGLKIYG